MTPAQIEATKAMAKRGAAVDIALIAGELFVAAAGGYAAVTNSNPFTGGQISQSWDGLARISVAGGAVLATADAARRSQKLASNLKVLSE
jgi:hypothetical protein